jgi:hypothetical protein
MHELKSPFPLGVIFRYLMKPFQADLHNVFRGENIVK